MRANANTTANLHETLTVLVRKERRILNEILELLGEVNRRKLFLNFGHSSLLKYCVKELGYSESAAYRRIKALRVTQELPAVKKKLEEGAVNLTQLCRAQDLFETYQKENKKSLGRETKGDLMKKIEKKESFESENLLRGELGLPLKKRRIIIRVSEETYEEWIKFKGAMVHKQMTDEMLLRFSIEKAMTIEEPRQYKRREHNCAARSIPAKYRRELMKRAGYKCAWKGCESAYGLEIDHIVPVSHGGKTELGNLRVLCRHHNQYRNFFEGKGGGRAIKKAFLRRP